MRNTTTGSVLVILAVLLAPGWWVGTSQALAKSSPPTVESGDEGEPTGSADSAKDGAEDSDDPPTDDSDSDGDDNGTQVEPGPPTQVVDFTEEAGPSVEMMTAQDPTPLKHKSLIRKKFRGPEPGGVAAEQLVETPSRWSIGVHLGGSWVRMQGADQDDLSADGALGASVAGFAEFRATGLVAIHPELRLSWKGALTDAMGATTQLGYVEIPVLLKAMLPVGGATVALGAGPALAVSLRSAVGDTQLERFTLSGMVDVSARTSLAGTQWLLSARYEHGLSDLASAPAMELSPVRPRVLSLGVGAMF